jgi:two-component system response regulator EvgA
MAAILVVENERNLRLLLREELEHEGHSVVCAGCGEDALAELSTAMPDLIVMDIGLPDMDGLELLCKLIAANRSLPVVIYTGDATYRNSFMTRAAGAYVMKRSDLTELNNAIRSLLARDLPKALADDTAPAGRDRELVGEPVPRLPFIPPGRRPA